MINIGYNFALRMYAKPVNIDTSITLKYQVILKISPVRNSILYPANGPTVGVLFPYTTDIEGEKGYVYTGESI